MIKRFTKEYLIAFLNKVIEIDDIDLIKCAIESLIDSLEDEK